MTSVSTSEWGEGGRPGNEARRPGNETSEEVHVQVTEGGGLGTRLVKRYTFR